MDQRVTNGATLLGTALTMFGIGTIIPTFWQKLVMFGSCFVFLVFAIIAFFEREGKHDN